MSRNRGRGTGARSLVFGAEDAQPIPGVTALESTGLGVDPVTRTLRRTTAKPLK